MSRCSCEVLPSSGNACDGEGDDGTDGGDRLAWDGLNIVGGEVRVLVDIEGGAHHDEDGVCVVCMCAERYAVISLWWRVWSS
jgi:hypothetical protein